MNNYIQLFYMDVIIHPCPNPYAASVNLCWCKVVHIIKDNILKQTFLLTKVLIVAMFVWLHRKEIDTNVRILILRIIRAQYGVV